MELEKLSEWNPWWENGNVSEGLTGKVRPEYNHLVDSVKIKEITIITGVRRSGKSTLMHQMINNLLSSKVDKNQILFVNLEDKKLTKDTLDDIYQCYRENLNPNKKAYIFIDEIHKKEGWESWIRKKYDLKTGDKFVISGSCSYLLKKDYSTLLTGRNLTFDVFPLSFGEFLLFKGVQAESNKIEKGILLEKTKITILKCFKEYLTLGGFPEILFRPEDYKTKLLEQYFDDIIYKDIVDRYNLNAQKTKDFALFLMTNFTSFISLRNIRNSLQLSYDTIKDYLSAYKEASIFFTIDHFSYSFKEQKTLASKIYCIDNGLRNSVSFKFSKDEGKLAENMVFLDIKRRGLYPYYWKKKGEVDFVVKDKNQGLTGINVSYTDEIEEREMNGLLEFKKEFRSKVKQMIILTKNTARTEHGIKFIPLWKWLLT